ncbi:hypothetical protein [Haloechinothrix sp. LS1_15]|uniref:hypothetical protein n=1 Tax=Haloechinothrix sp. LS1_15 TaxID=2652248 RepID=UPI00294817E6|nr:hypothetical protein [Haloechinothrix sp. LS1_15]MDV6014022.1 hypothetical protein [Haloechinothrix sp. LS1_15]
MMRIKELLTSTMVGVMVVGTAVTAGTASAAESTSDTASVTQSASAEVPHLQTSRSDDADADAQQCPGGGSVWAPPGYRWGRAQSSCAVLGSPGHEVTYTWWTRGDVDACVGVRYYSNGEDRWWGTGCGSFRRVSVPWGNNADYPAIRATSGAGVLGVIVDFAH